jgi:clavulanate-9-aldehyde reducatase
MKTENSTRQSPAVRMLAWGALGFLGWRVLRSLRQGEDLAGRRGLGTGGSRGLGLLLARAFADQGCRVAICARDVHELEMAERELRQHSPEVLTVPCDVADRAQVADMVEWVTTRFGGIDVLVNNAGVMLIGPVEGADTERWRRMIDANVYGVLYCTHAALPAMREAGRGHIVNVSSIAGRRANPYFAVYNLTKFGVTAFSEALRQELAESEIRVTVVEPGFVETELTSHNDEIVRQGSEKMKEKLVKVLDPQDIAAAILDAVSRPAHVNVSEIVVMPTRQK